MKKKASYIEPPDYFPKEVRKKFKLGEFNTDSENEERKQNPDSMIDDFGDYIAAKIEQDKEAGKDKT